MAEVKVFFQLEPDEDGWPPVNVESVWAHPGEVEGEYVIDNIPFFTREATDGDVVAVRHDDNGTRWFDEVVRPSRNSLIRIIFHDDDQVDPVRERLKALGCATEYFGAYHLLAVSIPPREDLVIVQNELREREAAGHLAYEEAILW